MENWRDGTMFIGVVAHNVLPIPPIQSATSNGIASGYSSSTPRTTPRFGSTK
jgi:hypothetical protein